MLIDHGLLIYDGDIERIKSEYGRYRTLVVALRTPDALAAAARAPSSRAAMDSIARFRFDRNRERADLLIRQASERYSLEDVTIEEPELESIIRRIYVEGYGTRAQESLT